MFRHLLAALTVASLLVFGVSSASAEEAASKSAFTDVQRSELNAMIKQFILDNPQVMITSVENYYNKQNDAKKAQEGSLNQVPAGLYDDPRSPWAGNKDAKFVIVEFFDYNCGFCKQVASDVDRLIKEEKNIKFIFKELPILSEMSEVASRYALAANMQGKYLEYHDALMSHQGPFDPSFLEQTGKDLGLDVAKLKKDADSQDVRDTLNKNMELARILGARGTPFFLFGKTKVPGAIGYSRMKEMIAMERDGVKTPVAPTPEPETPSAAPGTSSDYSPSSDPDIKAAIDDAKKETGDMLKDLQKQAADMRKAAEEMMKQQKSMEGKPADPAAAAELAKKQQELDELKKQLEEQSKTKQ